MKHSAFPLSDQPGDDFSDIDYTYMRAAAQQSSLFSSQEWHQLLVDHAHFLKAGGGGGDWQTMNLNGVILGLYAGPEVTQGAHATLNNRRLHGLPLKNINLSSANMVGVIAIYQDFSSSNLSHALITDADFKGTSFFKANCIGADFSRSQMQNCNFQNANLKYCDFENCDLTGSDFTGANLKHSRFPGAILTKIKY